jgi:diguanylate cyclase (GGDEF)-like protein/PAS domain S-box-containing protein
MYSANFFSSSSALMCVLNTEGTIMQVNPAWQKKLHLSPHELEHSSFLTWVHPADQAETDAHLAKLTQQSSNITTITFCHRWRDNANHYRWLLWEMNITLQNTHEYQENNQSTLDTVNNKNEPSKKINEQKHINNHLKKTNKKNKTSQIKKKNDCGNRTHNQHRENKKNEKNVFILYAVATDITAQKQLEKQLRDAEERFELAIRGSNHGLWDWNLKTNEIYLSPRWKNILGYEEHEIANHIDEWSRFVHPDDFTYVWGTIEAYLDHQQGHYESTYRVHHKDGQYRWVLARAAALWDKAGQPYRMVGTYTDVTENKRLEQALQENEALLTAVFNVTKIGICVTDKAGYFIRVNPAYCKLYGATIEELYQQHFTTVLSPEKHDKALKLHHALLNGDPHIETEGEWRIQTKTGQWLDINFTMGVFTQPDGQRFRVTTVTDITHRKHDEAERHRLFNLSLDMQSIIGFDLSFIEINAAWERILGWTKAELLDKSPLELVHPDDKLASLRTIQQLTNGKSIFNFENRYLCKNGTYKWLSWNVYPLVEQKTMYMVIRDITEQKQAAEEIQRQQAFIRLVVDSVPNLIFIKNRLNHFIFVNQAVANLLGTTVEQLVHYSKNDEPSHSLSLEELYSPAEQEVIEQKREVIVEENCLNANGEQRCFQLIKKPFVQNDGDVLILSVGTDITDRNQQEQALKLSEIRYRAIVQDQTDLICRFLPDGTLTFVNQAFCDYFGKSENQCIGQPFMPLTLGKQELFEQRLKQVTPQRPVVIGEYQTSIPDGNPRWQQWIDRAMFDSEGKIIEYQAVGRDITERKQAEAALRQSEERLRIVTGAAPVILFAIDNQGIITFVSGKALSILNLTSEKLMGQSLFAKSTALPIPPEKIRRALAGYTVTCLINLPKIVLETKITPLLDSQQQVTGLIGVSIDITKRYTLELQLKDAIAELEFILNNSIIGIAYLKHGVFVRINNKLENLLGYAHNELCGSPFSLIHPNFQEYQTLEQRAFPLFRQGKEYDAEHLLQAKNGDLFWSRIVGKAVDANDLEKGIIWIIEDITVQKEAQQHLRLTATIFETSANGIFVTDTHNRIQRINPAFTKITGYTLADVYQQKTSKLSSGQHDHTFYQNLWQNIKETGHWQGEIWNRKKNGEVYVAWLSISAITNEQGIATQYMAVLTDISSLQEDIEKVRYLANYDSLTRLPNRLLFHDHLLQAKAWAKRNEQIFALLFIDLDGFKPVNDNLGHAIGDKLLQSVAKRLQNCVRETDTVARLGGDEFTLILNNIKNPQNAAQIAEKIVQQLQQPFQLTEHQVTISASIGISLYPYDNQDVDQLLEQADVAMYEAKHAGKGHYCFYNTTPADGRVPSETL